MLDSQDSTEHIHICCFLLVYSDRPQTSHQDARKQANLVETFLLPTDAHNVKKHRVIKTF